MKFQNLHTDNAALEELGSRLTQLRIGMNMTQVELARNAGIGKRTLERLEAGESTQTKTLIRILRQLDLLAQLEVLLPEPRLRPMRIIREGGVLPQRVARRKQKDAGDDAWKWGDEK